MKRKILTIIMLFVTTVAFAQVPRHQRVLNYVPDSCYSFYMINLDTLARVSELEALHKDNVLKPLYDSLKFSKKFVQSWLKRDNKTGIDFTASVAAANSRYYFIPLNNEKNFEKTLRSIDKSFSPFETITLPNGQKIRCLVLDAVPDLGLAYAIICTPDVACVAMLSDMTDIYANILSAYSDSSSYTLKKETPVQIWERLSHSQFANSEAANTILTRDMNGYTAYNHLSPLVQLLVGFAGNKLPDGILNAFQQLNLEVFSKAEVRRDRITSISEFRHNNDENNILNVNSLRYAPEKLERLLPYMGEHSFLLATCGMEGASEIFDPYLNEFTSLTSLTNNPFFISLNYNDLSLFGTIVDNPDSVQIPLENYITAHNHILDSLYQVQEEKAKQIEADFSEEMLKDDDYTDFANYINNIEPFGRYIDSVSNRKFLTISQKEGWTVYNVITKNKEMDYETQEWGYGYDTSFVLVKDGLLFYAQTLSVMELLSHPKELENTSFKQELLSHPAYLWIYPNPLISSILGDITTLPIHDLTCYLENNSFVMNFNAEPGLKHGILYEVIKFTINVITENFTNRHNDYPVEESIIEEIEE
jgi:hypothetical protein